MRTLLVVFAIALVRSTLSAPAEDFSIDMYSGPAHMRFLRSTDEAAAHATSGTVVTIENAATAAAKDAPAKVEKIEQTALKLEDALNLVRSTMEKLEAESSAEAKTSSVETHEAVQTAQTQATAAAAIATGTSKPLAPSESAHQRKFQSQQATETTVRLTNPKYMFKYGDVLNRINKDQAQMLTGRTKSAYPEQFDRVRQLAAGTQAPRQQQDNSRSISRVLIRGQDMQAPNHLAPPPAPWQQQQQQQPRGEATSNLRTQTTPAWGAASSWNNQWTPLPAGWSNQWGAPASRPITLTPQSNQQRFRL